MSTLEFDRSYTAFIGSKKVGSGTVLDVASKVKKRLQKTDSGGVLIFDDVTSAQLEIDFRGPLETVLKRIRDAAAPKLEKPVGPGRPKLGVVSREIGLLPRHWEWLALQPGGASVTLRKLVEDAKKKNRGQDEIRRSQDATYKFIFVMAGDLPQYEEALRALYAKDSARFGELTAPWPKDVREHAGKLSQTAFGKSPERE